MISQIWKLKRNLFDQLFQDIFQFSFYCQVGLQSIFFSSRSNGFQCYCTFSSEMCGSLTVCTEICFQNVCGAILLTQHLHAVAKRRLHFHYMEKNILPFPPTNLLPQTLFLKNCFYWRLDLENVWKNSCMP